MKFLIDAQLPPSLARWLCANGSEALHVEHANLRNATDDIVCKFAVTQRYVIVTKDKDFVSTDDSQVSGSQVVWIRTGNVPNSVLMRRVAASWPDILAHLKAGARVVELR